MTVYVIQRPTQRAQGYSYDASSGAKFGELVYIFESEDRISDRPEVWIKHAEKILEDFDDTQDYILWAGGDPAALAIVSVITSDITLGHIPLLKWDKRRGDHGEYYPINLNI